MRTEPDCIACLMRQARDFLRLAVADDTAAERCLRVVLRELADEDFDVSPPVVASRMQRRLRELSGCDDPFKAIKQRFNALALEVLPRFEARVAAAPDPFAAAVRLAIAANVIDFGTGSHVDQTHLERDLAAAMDVPVSGDMAAFAAAVQQARRILFLADNAGEIVFDQPLLRRLPAGRVTIAVRGGAVFNDALLVDAEATGMSRLHPVIANGSDVPGTYLSACSDEFRQAFDAADLIISKGQGNFETVHDLPKHIFALFMVKCPVVARTVGLPLGAKVLAAVGRMKAE